MRMGEPKLELAKVRFYGSGEHRHLMYTYHGGFMERDQARVLWIPAEVPEPPSAEEFALAPDPKETNKCTG